mmetsp:Transcript_23944/g.40680  ORF Transcript_23944/g.40680 Transcript_23944/m.40680 type:complete len:94 (+) Transcript_23944:146-427(+)
MAWLNNILLHVMRFPLVFLILLHAVQAGRAPDEAPKLPEGFCPKATGTATATTGECMCNWEHKDACVGTGCQYQMGLSWYHYSCKDCRCVSEP